MSYSEPLVNQVRVFFLSVGVGVPLCLLYIAVQSFFRVFGKRKQVFFVSDMVFCVLCAFISFFFMVFYNNGRVRLHLILGEALGFLVFYRSIGKHLLFLGVAVAEKLSQAFRLMLFPFVRVGRAFLNGAVYAASFVKEKMCARKTNEEQKEKEEADSEKKSEKKRKKFNLISKIPLKNRNKSV